MAPTIIIASIILALMTVGVLFLVDYIRQPAADLSANSQSSSGNTAAEVPSETPRDEPVSSSPNMNSIKVEFTALSEPVALLVTADGKTSSTTVSPNTSVLFEPKEALKLSYSRSLASVVQLTINGKKITLPAQPLIPRRNAIEIEINKANLPRIWESGSIQYDVAPQGSTPDSNAVSNSSVTPPAPARTIPSQTRRPAATTNGNSESEKPPAGAADVPRKTPAPVPAKTPGPPSNR